MTRATALLVAARVAAPGASPAEVIAAAEVYLAWLGEADAVSHASASPIALSSAAPRRAGRPVSDYPTRRTKILDAVIASRTAGLTVQDLVEGVCAGAYSHGVYDVVRKLRAEGLVVQRAIAGRSRLFDAIVAPPDVKVHGTRPGSITDLALQKLTELDSAGSSPAELARALERKPGSVNVALIDLFRSGRVQRRDHRYYALGVDLLVVPPAPPRQYQARRDMPKPAVTAVPEQRPLPPPLKLATAAEAGLSALTHAVYDEVHDRIGRGDTVDGNAIAVVLKLKLETVHSAIEDLVRVGWLRPYRGPDGWARYEDLRAAPQNADLRTCACNRRFRPEAANQVACQVCRLQAAGELETGRW